MFYLYQSDRLEALAEMCAHIHQALPLDAVLAQEEVVVQSQGMRRYLKLFLRATRRGGEFEVQPAGRFGVAADAQIGSRCAAAQPVFA